MDGWGIFFMLGSMMGIEWTRGVAEDNIGLLTHEEDREAAFQVQHQKHKT